MATPIPSGCAECGRPVTGHGWRRGTGPRQWSWHQYKTPPPELRRGRMQERLAAGVRMVADATTRTRDDDELREPPLVTHSTEATVSDTRPRVAATPVYACGACDVPREGHGVRYAALEGPHEWRHPAPSQVEQRRRAAGLLSDAT